MTHMTMVMPSRTRPDKARIACDIAFKNVTNPNTQIWVVRDASDLSYADYAKAFRGSQAFLVTADGNMVQRSNVIAQNLVDLSNMGNMVTDVIGWMADDTHMVTPGWDSMVLEHFEDGAHIVTVNDGHMDKARPQSAWFISTSAVGALGYLCLPTSDHLYVDDAWAVLRDNVGGAGQHCSAVLAEHMHPNVNKGEWDDQYRTIHTPDNYGHDRTAFETWKSGQLALDTEKVLAL